MAHLPSPSSQDYTPQLRITGVTGDGDIGRIRPHLRAHVGVICDQNDGDNEQWTPMIRRLRIGAYAQYSAETWPRCWGKCAYSLPLLRLKDRNDIEQWTPSGGPRWSIGWRFIFIRNIYLGFHFSMIPNVKQYSDHYFSTISCGYIFGIFHYFTSLVDYQLQVLWFKLLKSMLLCS